MGKNTDIYNEYYKDMSEDTRKMIDGWKMFAQINEGAISDFKYDAVRTQIQKAMENGSLRLEDISPNKYFIVVFGAFNVHMTSLNVSDKFEAIKLINHYKKDDNVWRIYVEKPSVDAKVFLRKEWGWVGK